MTDPVRVTSDYDGVLAERVEALERLTDRMLRCLLTGERYDQTPEPPPLEVPPRPLILADIGIGPQWMNGPIEKLRELWPNATLIEATPDLSRQWRARPHTELSGWSESRDAQLYERV